MTKRKKRRFKLKVKRIISLLVITALITVVLINLNNIKIFYLSKTTKYNTDTINVFLEKDILEEVKEQKYSKTLEKVIQDNAFEDKYLEEYLKITFQDKKTFVENINSLLKLGYKNKNINKIYELLNDDSIELLTKSKYIEDINNIITLSYFNEDSLERYIKYYDKEKLNEEDAVTYVNIGLDNKYYTNIIKLKEEDAVTAIVNKYHSLSKNYVPKNLQNVKYGSGQLRKDAKEAFDKMCDAARKDKIYISGGSGYRSYSYQETLYNNYVARDGFNAAETYSARPGYSEHQTGLAMDVVNERGEFISASDKEYKWLIDNSYKYGFILRYPKGKDKLTGYMYEEWHYRYLGIDVATKVYESKLTYDEFVARNLF